MLTADLDAIGAKASITYECAFVAWLLLAVLLRTLEVHWLRAFVISAAGIAVIFGFAIHDVGSLR